MRSLKTNITNYRAEQVAEAGTFSVLEFIADVKNGKIELETIAQFPELSSFLFISETIKGIFFRWYTLSVLISKHRSS